MKTSAGTRAHSLSGGENTGRRRTSIRSSTTRFLRAIRRRGRVRFRVWRVLPSANWATSASFGESELSFLEMPGLCLTIEQAQRLWSLEPRTCEALLRSLIDASFLRRTDCGLFVLRRPRG